MVAAVLFTWPDRRFGPTATNLFRVKGMTEILVTVEGWNGDIGVRFRL
jgi:hypothetical protein